MAINGYNLIRRDRRDVIHGGVCMYIKASIPFTILEDLEDESGSLEVLWIKLRPFRLPRGISSIIAGVVYHPPKATNSMMLDYWANSPEWGRMSCLNTPGWTKTEGKCPTPDTIAFQHFCSFYINRRIRSALKPTSKPFINKFIIIL